MHLGQSLAASTRSTPRLTQARFHCHPAACLGPFRAPAPQRPSASARGRAALLILHPSARGRSPPAQRALNRHTAHTQHTGVREHSIETQCRQSGKRRGEATERGDRQRSAGGGASHVKMSPSRLVEVQISRQGNLPLLPCSCSPSILLPGSSWLEVSDTAGELR